MKRHKLRRRPYALSTGFFALFALASGSPAHETGEVEQLEETVVEGRGQDLTGIAEGASVGRVGLLELANRPLLRAGEILEVVPGLIITQHSGTGKANQFFLRGFNLDHGTDFSTSVDGMPINLRTHGHGQGYLDLNLLIPELIDYIEFKKGLYYPEVGDFSSAGTSTVYLADALPKGLAEFGAGEDDFYRGLFANSSQLGAGDLLYAGEVQYYDGPWVREENLRKFNGLLRYTGGRAGRGYSLTAMGYDADWDATDQIPQRAVDSGLISRLGALDLTDGGDSSRFSLSGRYWHEHEKAATRAGVYAVYYDLDLFSNFTYFLDDPVNGDQFEQVDERVYFGGDVSHQWLTDRFLGSESQHELGLQLRHDHIMEVGLHKTAARQRLSTVRDDAVDEFSVGAYYRNETRWKEKFRTVVGLRGDFFYFDVDSLLDANSGSETDGVVSPKASLIFGPWWDTEIYLNGGFGYHSNDARGTVTTIDPANGDPASPLRSAGALERRRSGSAQHKDSGSQLNVVVLVP